ncbi:ChaN family lipoprotein [Vreelandella zhuhanensis]|nr:ChaN family lipoprotein [Halomonas zhuhanensis]
MPHRLRIPGRATAVLMLAILAALPGTAMAEDDACLAPGQWFMEGALTTPETLLATAARQEVVMLGERHDEKAHHRWQLHTLAGLYAHRSDMVIGLEMLPRDVQPVLDAWVAGELSEEAFIRESNWKEVWGIDAELYLPILHFARMQQVPLVALNIQPALRQRLAREGWQAVPSSERHAITAPEAATPAYRERLTQIFQHHPAAENPAAENEEEKQEGQAQDKNEGAALESFIQAQLAWDRAMADGLATAAQNGSLAVGLMGYGHVIHGDGVPHQLQDLGISRQMALLPLAINDCQPPDASLADGVYVLDEAVESSD